MLNVTVKTLDSRSRPFSVADDITVRGFKESIAESVNIPADRQRLIFQGRVLQDDAQLNATGEIDGKVLHLVERLPTAPNQPTSGTNQPASQQRHDRPTPASQSAQANILGQFGIPTGGGQFVQQMIQQALQGTVVRGSLRHPNTPGGDTRTEIQIRIEGQANPSSSTPGSSSGPRSSTTISSPIQRNTSQPHGGPTQAQSRSAPNPTSFSRNHLLQIQCLTDTFEEVLGLMDEGNFEEADRRVSGTPSTTCPAGSGPVSSPPQVAPSVAATGRGRTSASTSSTTNVPSDRPPRLVEFGALMRRIANLETRFRPYFIEYVEFMEEDPAFQSTESPEFRRIRSVISLVMKIQRLLGMIHRNASLAVIPISETPPRSMYAQDRSRGRGTTSAGRASNLHHHRLSHLDGPGHGTTQPPRVVQGQVRFPVLISSVAGSPRFVTAPFQGPPGPGGMLRSIRPHQSGLYGHPPSSTSTTASNRTSVTATPSTTTSSSSSTPPALPPVGAIPPNLQAMFPPSEYRVHVTTHVEPQININVSVPSSAPSADEDLFVGDQIEAAATPPPPANTQDTIQAGDINVGQIPNIPGVSSDGMQRIVEAVRSSVQQVVGTTAGSSTSRQARTIGIDGLSQNMDVIPMEIAQIIGDTVQDIVLTQLHTDQESRATYRENQPTTTSTSEPVSNTQPATSAASSSETSTTTASTTTTATTAPSSEGQGPRNPLAEMMQQVAGGAFGSVVDAFSAPASEQTASNGSLIEGCAGPNRTKLPEIQRTANCVNDLVRGQGYPREMMELTGHETILSILMFMCGELFTVTDCMTFVAGSTAPAQRLREPLRRVITECWFDGKDPTQDQIEAEVDQHSDLARPVLEEVFRDASPKSPDISIIESNLSLYRFVLRKLLQLLYIHDADRFSSDILSHMMDSYALALNLNSHILRGTEQTVTSLISDYLGTAIGSFTIGGSAENRAPMADQLQQFITANMMPFARSRPISQDQIDQFIMNVPSPMERSPDPSALTTESERKEEEPVPATTPSAVDTASAPATVESPKPAVVDEPMESDEEGANAGGDVGDDVDWRLTVPNDWVPVIELDIEKQKNMPEQHEPHSEAYLAGTPASKRRKI